MPYYLRATKTAVPQGPFEVSEIVQQIAKGLHGSDAQLAKPGEADWVSIVDVPELAIAFSRRAKAVAPPMLVEPLKVKSDQASDSVAVQSLAATPPPFVGRVSTGPANAEPTRKPRHQRPQEKSEVVHQDPSTPSLEARENSNPSLLKRLGIGSMKALVYVVFVGLLVGPASAGMVLGITLWLLILNKPATWLGAKLGGIPGMFFNVPFLAFGSYQENVWLLKDSAGALNWMFIEVFLGIVGYLVLKARWPLDTDDTTENKR